jgi:hypothetical protein
MLSLRNKIMMAVFLSVILIPYTSFANDYFVRPTGTCTNSGDGTAYSCASNAGKPGAWIGFSKIQWGSLGASDNLYVAGTHKENLTIQAGGDPGGDLTVRGDYPGDAGILASGHNLYWDIPGSYPTIGGYLTIYGMTLLEGKVETKRRDADGLSLRADKDKNTITCSNCNWNSLGVKAGMGIRLRNIAGPDTHLIASVSNTQITIDVSGNNWDVIEDQSFTSNTTFFWPTEHVTIDNCTIDINRPMGGSIIANVGCNNFTIKNTEVDGNQNTYAGVCYPNVNWNHKLWTNHVYDGNYFHDIKTNQGDNPDHHDGDNQMIGYLGGTNGLQIIRNHFKNAPNHITLYEAKSAGFIGLVDIRYNYFENVVIGWAHVGQWDGVHYAETGSGGGLSTAKFVIAYNIFGEIIQDGTCSDNPAQSPICAQTMKLSHAGNHYVYNNTIYRNIIGPRLQTDDILFQNNIITETKLTKGAHIWDRSNSGHCYEQDYNIIYPDSGDTMIYSNNAGYPMKADLTISEYYASNKFPSCYDSGGEGLITSNPSLDSNLRPNKESDPPVDNGKTISNVGGIDLSIGLSNAMALSDWPNAAGGGSFTYADQDSNGSGWDIGAFIYGGNTEPTDDTQSPSAPENLRIIDTQ